MPSRSYAYTLLAILVVLIVINIYLFRLDSKEQNQELTFAMLDIGQGDGLFIESPTGIQILFDAGPPKKILGQLAKVMSPFDRRIDAIVVTNPDLDHLGGVIDVLKHYKVDQVFEPGTFNDSKTYQNFESTIQAQNIPNTRMQKGMRLDIGGGAVIDVLFPDRDVSTWDSNDGSVVAKLTYGNTSILLSGDATSETEKIILEEFSQASLHSTILKVGHHGSRTSSSDSFVKAVAPTYALISNGKTNTYGHPHPNTLNTLTQLGTKILRTDMLGTIIMKSDGQKESFSFAK